MIEISSAALAISFAVSIFVILAVILTVYIVMTLRKFNNTLDNINALIDDNRRNLKESMESLPKISENLNSITSSLKDKVDLIDSHISARDETATASAIDMDSFVSTIASTVELFSEIKNMFRKNKKRYQKR